MHIDSNSDKWFARFLIASLIWAIWMAAYLESID